MIRKTFAPRKEYDKRNIEVGFDFGNLDGCGYWNETAGYKFNAREIDRIEAATNELFEMVMAVVPDILSDKKLMTERFGYSEGFQKLIQKSWDEYHYSVYGRFDLAYDGTNIKMYEFNADTPTSLLESSLIQYYWMVDRGLGDQFNSIHEKLIESWKFIKEKQIGDKTTYFTSMTGYQEDYRTVEYMMDTAKQAGVNVSYILLHDIGSDGKHLYDLESKKMDHIFKLYPWEWMVDEKFGETVLQDDIRWIEPAWRALLSCKAMLPVLWNKYPRHNLLLPASFEEQSGYVKKPIFGREGGNITLPGQEEQPGPYGKENFIYQQYQPLTKIDNVYPMIGSWVIGDQAAGIGIRESDGLITGNTSRFTPHWFE